MINDGMNGPVTMAFANEVDSIGRRTRSVSAHSNVGCSVTEYVYSSDERHTYSYGDVPSSEGELLRGEDYRKVLAALRSVAEVDSLPEVRAALKGTRYLSFIEKLDTAGRTLDDFRFNEQGDTTGHNIHVYNAAGQEVYFKYGGDSPEWTWEYFATLNSAGNQVRWARVQERNGVRDTTEKFVDRYDAAGRHTDQYRYTGALMHYVEQYSYNKRGDLIKTRAVNTSELDKVWLTKYKRKRDGSVTRERHYTVVKGKAKLDHDYRFTYTYW